MVSTTDDRGDYSPIVGYSEVEPSGARGLNLRLARHPESSCLPKNLELPEATLLAAQFMQQRPRRLKPFQCEALRYAAEVVRERELPVVSGS